MRNPERRLETDVSVMQSCRKSAETAAGINGTNASAAGMDLIRFDPEHPGDTRRKPYLKGIFGRCFPALRGIPAFERERKGNWIVIDLTGLKIP